MKRSHEISSGTPFELPVQREAGEDERGYDPVRDLDGKELPHYYGKYEPLSDAEAERQDAINQAGSAQVRAVLAALKEARRHNKNNTSV